MADHEHDRAQAQQQMHNIPHHAYPDLDAYFQACGIAARVVSELQPMYVELETRWSALAQLEQAQPGLSLPSWNNAQNQAAAARNQANSTREVLEAIRRNCRNRPPVPQDAYGGQRMPENWYQERRGVEELLKLRTPNPAGILGLFRHGTWRPVLQFGGGQSSGHLWVLLDPDHDIVTDVSCRFPILGCSLADAKVQRGCSVKIVNCPKAGGLHRGVGMAM